MTLRSSAKTGQNATYAWMPGKDIGSSNQQQPVYNHCALIIRYAIVNREQRKI